MKGVGEQKISDVARIDGDELCEVAGGAVPVGSVLSGVLSDQAHVEESGGEHMFQFHGGIEVPLRLSVVVNGEVDRPEIGVGRRANLSIGRQPQDILIAGGGL